MENKHMNYRFQNFQNKNWFFFGFFFTQPAGDFGFVHKT